MSRQPQGTKTTLPPRSTASTVTTASGHRTEVCTGVRASQLKSGRFAFVCSTFPVDLLASIQASSMALCKLLAPAASGGGRRCVAQGADPAHQHVEHRGEQQPEQCHAQHAEE